MSRLVWVVLAIAFIACSNDDAGPSEVSPTTTAKPAVVAAERAPTFVLPSASGGEFSYPQDVKGAPALLYFSMGPG